jgi:GNAT superfamily N-acetyltransferase
MSRLFLTAAPSVIAGHGTPLPSGFVIEPLTIDEIEESGALLYAAYQASDDPEPAELDELKLFWSGEWGLPIPSATFCVRRVDDGVMVALSVVCASQDGPLIAHLATDEFARRNGLGAALLETSAAALQLLGEEAMYLAVDAANPGPLRLYARIGFRLYADGCLQNGVVTYTTLEQVAFVEAMIDRAAPTLELPSRVTLHVSYPAAPQSPHGVTKELQCRLTKRLLAVVVGYRNGDAEVTPAHGALATVIELLSAAEHTHQTDITLLSSFAALKDAGKRVALRFSN